eukprot:5314-Heterococcus_DN1.PRE.3
MAQVRRHSLLSIHQLTGIYRCGAVVLLQKWEDCWDEVYCCSKSCKEKRRKAKADEAYKVKQAARGSGDAPSALNEMKQQDSSSDID